CVVLAAALGLVAVDDPATADDVADVVAEAAEPDASPDLFSLLHPAPISANAAIAAENAAVPFRVARISFLRNRFGPAVDVPTSDSMRVYERPARIGLAINRRNAAI